MIRLSFPILDNPIEIAENVVNVLILESPRCFRELVCDIKEISNKLEGKTKLSKDFEIIPYDKFVHTVFSAEAIDINCKKILNKIIGNLREIAYSEIMCEKTMKINCEFLGYISDLTENTTLDLIYDEFNIDSLLKVINLKIATNEKNFLENLCDYIDIVNETFGFEIFLFFNLKAYLEDEELIELYKHCNYRKIKLLICENTVRQKLTYEKLIIVDKDLCCIY